MEAMALSEEERLPHNDDGYDVNNDDASLGVVSMHDEDHRDKDLATDLVSSGKKLKQANLFEIWGFGRNIAVESVSSVSVESKPN
ncbi:unnamed protein product [Lupinus luteus]|uniref:Uncharacterized protein n=1 Tax=Lupinus luteus TaxID=3873 RepID=A0AAV1WW71_LUPLU